MTRTVGVEEEYLIVDSDAAALRPAGERVAAGAERGSDGQFEHELKREQAELGSKPHHDLAELRAELHHRRAELARSAAEQGARVVAIGTSPVDGASTTTPEDRYRAMDDIFGDTARSALSCGMHVHVGVASRAEGVRVLDGIRGWLPVVLALSANSPFLDGRDTGHQSYRSMLWQQWPSAGPFGSFADEADYDATVAALVACRAAIDEHGLYFDARLSVQYPTVEVRVADVCPWVGDAAALAGLCRALVDGCVTGVLPRTSGVYARVELVRAGTWRAARYGLEDTLLHPVSGRLVPAWELVDELVETLRPVLEDDLVADSLTAIRRRGTGSRMQREVYERTGDLAAVLDAVAVATLA